MPELFSQVASRYADQVAVLSDTGNLTYRELDERSDAWARCFLQHGAGSARPIALCVGRSPELIVILLAILKAGAAYLPLESSYPAQRISFLLEDGSPSLVIYDREHARVASGFGGPQLVVEDGPSGDLSRPLPRFSPETIAYILFTSGSTGKPKGVLVPHRAIHRLVRDANYARLDDSVTFLQAAPVAFDASTLEIWGPLLNGGRVAIYPDSIPTGRGLRAAIERFHVTSMWLTAALFNTIVDEAPQNLRGLSELLIGGEALSVPHVRRALGALSGLRLINGYGPTETTTFATCHLIDLPGPEVTSVPIGRALQKTRLYVLDAERRIVPLGAEGELYIGGRGVALGYLNRPELTAERFVEDPVVPGHTVYRTGDLVSMRPDGVVEFVGRADQQVKIRGFRIELGEIEVALSELPGVRRAVVVALARAGEKRLVAYLVADSDSKLSQGEIRKRLGEKVPDYMVPSAFVWIDAVPLTDNGKVDYRALPKPTTERPSLDVEYVPPSSDLEHKLTALWSELIEVDGVGVRDNLFELGASSLLAVRACAKMSDLLSQEMPVVKVFQYPTIEGQARFLSKSESGASRARQSSSRIHRESRGVAVIGMAGRFPGAGSVGALWSNLLNGIEGVSFFDPSEIDAAVPREQVQSADYVRARGILPDIDLFDAGFFGVAPKEAALIDPQQRLLFEVAWETLEQGGYVPEKTPGLIGVFAGKYNNSYHSTRIVKRPDLVEELGEFQVMAWNEKDYVATRLAHRLNLRGPALSIHTACSTSLVAIVEAARSLERGDCDFALAGGSSITIPVRAGHLYQEGAMLSSDGHTRTFDQSATGTVFSDGVAMVLLRRFEDAERDGDTIYAVIRGAAINNDGSEKASFTAPSTVGQSEVVSAALDDAGISAADVGYVEAHGTATPLGDPIEVEALTEAYRRYTDQKQYCALGSVKSNLGHCVIAAGATGLMKAALSLHHEVIPKNLHFTAPNPRLNLDTSPFFVVQQNLPWARSERPRFSGVSSFGVGGTNAHVVLSEAPALPPRPAGDRTSELLVISGRTESAVRSIGEQLADWLDANPGCNLADVAFTLHTGRREFAYRRSMVVSSHAEAALKLREAASVPKVGLPPQIIFAFPGQGSQFLGMGAALYRESTEFRAYVDDGLSLLEDGIRARLKTLVFESPTPELSESELGQTSFAQPGLFLVEYALGRMLMSAGVKPDALLGHSVGEFVAAVLAQVMPLGHALRLVAARGSLMQGMSPGGMLSVRKPADEVVPLLPAELELAADNSPQLCVVAGPHDALRAFAVKLGELGIAAKELHTSHAFHSHMMDGAVEPFLALVSAVPLSPPRIPIVSTVTGTWLTSELALDPSYWAQQLRRAVRFAPAVRTAKERFAERGLFLEVGPRKALTTLIFQQAEGRGRKLAIAAGSDRADSGLKGLQTALGELFCFGVSLSAEAIHAPARRIPLPTYPFERKRFWVDLPADLAPTPRPAPGNVSETKMTEAAQSAIRNTIIQQLCATLEDISGIEVAAAEADVPFLELGLDSLFLTQFAISVQKKFGVKVTFRELQEELPTLGSLADHLAPSVPASAAPAAPAQQAPAQQPTVMTAPLPAATSVAPAIASPAAVAFAAPVVAFPPAIGGGQLQALIAAQLQLMTQQMALLSGAGVPALAAFAAAPSAAVDHVAAVAAPSVAAAVPTSAAAISKAGASAEANGAQLKGPTGLVEDEGPAGMVTYEVKKAFGAIARIHAGRRDEVTPVQRARIEAFIRRYTSRTRKSKEFTQESRAIMADPRVVTGFRPLLKELVYPIVVDKSRGSKVWDLDGNEYVDALNGFGLNLFGWQPEFVTKAIKDQLDQGHEIGPQHPSTAEAARAICEFTGFDRAAFCNTGSEAVMGCMRIARTVTGRSKIAIFAGSYHGIFDEVVVRGTKKLRSIPAAPGIMPNAHENVLVLDYGTPETMEILKAHAHELAAVLVEPVQSRRPDFRPKEFLLELRELTEKEGIVLIFDEVVCGFRLCPGGSQEYFGIKADLASYGKVLGGGLPIGVIAGKRRFMDALDGGHWDFGDDSSPPVGVTYFAGTFVRHPLAISSALAVLKHLKEQGPDLQRNLNARVEAFAGRLRTFVESVGAPIEIKQFASLWRFAFHEDYHWSDLFVYMMRDRGVHIWDGFPCFFTTAHSDEDFAKIEEAFKASVLELQDGEFIPRKVQAAKAEFDPKSPPVPGARLGRDPTGNPTWYVPNPQRAGQFVPYNPA